MNGEITNSRPRAVAVVATVMLSVVVVAVAGLYLLSDNGSGTATPPPVTPTSATPTSASPSPSEPEVEAPVLPAEAKEPTTKGAAAFVRYFFAAYDFAYVSFDTSPLRAASMDGCDFCSGAIENVDEAEAKGYTVESGGVEVTTAVAAPGEPTDGLVVNTLVQQTPVVTLDSKGAVVSRTDGVEDARIDVRVVWSGSAWRVRAVRVLES